MATKQRNQEMWFGCGRPPTAPEDPRLVFVGKGSPDLRESRSELEQKGLEWAGSVSGKSRPEVEEMFAKGWLILARQLPAAGQMEPGKKPQLLIRHTIIATNTKAVPTEEYLWEQGGVLHASRDCPQARRQFNPVVLHFKGDNQALIDELRDGSGRAEVDGEIVEGYCSFCSVDGGEPLTKGHSIVNEFPGEDTSFVHGREGGGEVHHIEELDQQ